MDFLNSQLRKSILFIITIIPLIMANFALFILVYKPNMAVDNIIYKLVIKVV